MNGFRRELILLIIFYATINVSYFLINIYPLKFFSEFEKLSSEPIHKLAKSGLNSLFIFKDFIRVQSLNFMKLFYDFFKWNHFARLFVVVVIACCAHKRVATPAHHGYAYILTFVLIFDAFGIVVHSYVPIRYIIYYVLYIRIFSQSNDMHTPSS